MSDEVVYVALTAFGIAELYGWGAVLDEYIKFWKQKSSKDCGKNVPKDSPPYRKV